MEKSKQAGEFILAPGKWTYGELTLLGSKTSLYLRSKEEFNTHSTLNQYIKGTLHDLTKVSLIDCVTMPVTGYVAKGGEKYHFATAFPHFVVHGDSHIAPHEKTIVQVHFAVDDATTLFYDFDAFGFLLDARPLIETVVNANALGRKISVGADPQILYFTGKREIFATDTTIGRVSASHNPRHTTLGGPSGVGLKNTIFVTIQFKEPVVFEQSILHLSTLLRYLEMLAGRPQNLVALDICTESGQQSPLILRVYWSMRPKREPNDKQNKPHPSDVLADAVRQPDDFSRVLVNWLDREKLWRDARLRFSNCFARQNHYSIDRLIGAANMFDILPGSAVRSNTKQPKRSRKTGRNAKNKLMQKIQHRAELITSRVGKRFPELVTVTDEAVNCRNYYIHGGNPRFDYNGNFSAVTFFIDTLEFVFAISDLIEAGWDAVTWSNIGTTMSHPFARYRINYNKQFEALKALLPP